jgi:hypothetical protein
MAQGSATRVDVFFYGLFMDETLLMRKGVKPANLRRAFLNDYSLVIGERAALIQKPGETVHGIVFSLTQDEIDSLYSEPSVREYRPEPVLANLADGSAIPALCFNLPTRPTASHGNSEYAAKLRALANRLDLPRSYIDKIVDEDHL